MTRGPRRSCVLTLLAAALGCGEDALAPNPATDPTLDAAVATQALSFIQVSAGSRQTCGVTTTNLAYCWGGSNALVPVAVPGGLKFQKVSVGDSHVCGITTDFRAYCWGSNGDGELGDGTTTSRNTPVAVAGNRAFSQITAGPGYTCAVTRWNLPFCWGHNNHGRLGIGRISMETRRLTPTAVAGGLKFRHIIAGGLHACGTTIDDRAYCWGSNYTGALGTSTPSEISWIPVAVSGGLRFSRVVAGGGIELIPSGQHYDGSSCGLTTDNLAYCWGDGTEGIGIISRTPVPVPGGHRFRGINLGTHHACAVTVTDVAMCWGLNDDGQVGDGTTIHRRQPVRVVGGLKFKSVTANTYSYHSCGVTTTNRAYCWGYNNSGQLGNGTTKYPDGELTPVPVAAPK
jgi:alpha-tubulin suppressor-like RCC1 family protein